MHASAQQFVKVEVDDADRLQFAVGARTVHVSRRATPDKLAPLFGAGARAVQPRPRFADWATLHCAGVWDSMLWECSIVLANHIAAQVRTGELDVRTARVLELGAGWCAWRGHGCRCNDNACRGSKARACSGAPGLAAHELGAAEVVLTERAPEVDVLRTLVRESFPGDDSLRVEEFEWGASPRHLRPPFDVVLASECISVDMYGEAWRLLAHALRSVCTPASIIFLALVRRRGDGFDEFEAEVRKDFDMSLTLVDAPHEVFVLRLRGEQRSDDRH